MTRKRFLAFFLLLALSASVLFAQSQYDTNDIKRHLYYLASDELGGRYPETEGSLKASEYLRGQYAKLGLKLLCDSGFQHFQPTIPNHCISDKFSAAGLFNSTRPGAGNMRPEQIWYCFFPVGWI